MNRRAKPANIDQHVDAVALDDRRQGVGIALADIAPLTAGDVTQLGSERIIDRTIAITRRPEAPRVEGLDNGLHHAKVADIAGVRHQIADGHRPGHRFGGHGPARGRSSAGQAAGPGGV